MVSKHGGCDGSPFWYDGLVAVRLSSVLVLGLASCSVPRQSAVAGWVPGNAPDLGDVVARVGAVPIYAGQVLAEARRSGKDRHEALTSLIDQNLLAELAHESGRRMPDGDDPDVRSALVERLLERDLEPSLQASAIPDSALRPIYERTRDSFVHGRLVEIGVLAVYTGPLMKGAYRQDRTTTAAELAAYVAKHPPQSLDDFAAVARDKPWADRSVVYKRLWQGPDKPFSATVGAQVAKLRAPGQTTPSISDETGFFIARYIDERPPENVSFEQARPKIVAAYLERWRKEQFLEFSAKLMRGHTIAAYFDRITPDEQGR
jgi:hypothetical protein